MDCRLIESDLVAFHFGAATDTPRDQLEAHLLGCAPCMAAFLALKRAAESGNDAQPSAEARARLRQAVAAEFVRAAPRAWMWGGAAAAVVVAAALLGFFTRGDSPSVPRLPPTVSAPQPIDSARREPLNLDFI